MKVRDLEIVTNLKGAQEKYHSLFYSSIVDMQMVLESQEFVECLEKRISSYKKRLAGERSEWKSRTAQEIVDHFLNVKDGKGRLNLIIHTYYTSDRVIGYGVEGDDITRVNTKYLSAYSVSDPYDRMEVGSNLCHEKGHDAGFDHDFNNNAERDNSICYIFNDAYEDAYKILIINNKPVKEPTVTTTPINPQGPIVVTPPTPPSQKKKVCKRYGFLWIKKRCWYE